MTGSNAINEEGDGSWPPDFSLDEIIFGATLSQLSQTRPLIRRIIELNTVGRTISHDEGKYEHEGNDAGT